MDRETQIAERRKQMPAMYRGGYDKAMRGRSLKSAVHAFCLECVGWQRKEVELCTSPACPLFPYRPYQEVPWKARRSNRKGKPFFTAHQQTGEKPTEHTNSARQVVGQGVS